MKTKILFILQTHKRTILGFGIYYLLFAIVMLYGLHQAWNLRLLNIILLLVLLLVSLGGDENYAVTFKAYRRDPFIAQELKEPLREMAEFELPTVILLVLPPVVFLLIDIFS